MNKPKSLYAKTLLVLSALCLSSNTHAALSGTYTIDPGGTASATVYLTLTSAISDLVSGTRADGGTANGSGVSGPVILELASGYTSAGETFPLTINSVTGASATNTITIRPASGVSSAILFTANGGTSTLTIDGGQYFIIDGRPGGSGSSKYITIDNTGAFSPSLYLINDASNNTIRYCTLTGVATNTGNGIIYFGASSGTTGNDNNTVDHCDIHDGTSNPLIGIHSTGTVAKSNSGNTVSNCNIYNFFNAGSASTGINIGSNNDTWTITGNSFYQTSALTATAGSIHKVIAISSGNGHVITNNYIGGRAANCGGSAWTISGAFTSRFVGIEMTGGTTTPFSVQGNTIANFDWSTSANTATTSGIFCGIFATGTNTAANIGTTSGNTIGSGTGTGSISVTTSGNNGLTVGIVSTGTGAVSISNNTIGSITTSGTTTSIGANITGIFIPTAATSGVSYTISNNTIGSTSTANSINASTASSGSQATTGISVTANGSGAGSTFAISNNTVANINNNTTGSSSAIGIREQNLHSISITGNTIRNLSTAGSGTGTNISASMVGIASSASGTGTVTISNNIIHSIANNYTGGNATFVNGMAIIISTSGGTNLIERNLVHSIYNAKSSGGNIVGFITSGPFTMSNNMIRLGIDASGSSITGNVVHGINVGGSAAQNYYHNSVYIGGSGVTSGDNSACFYINTSGAMDIRNNIIVNARSNSSGSSKHYNIILPSLTTLTMDYNLYYVTGTGGYQARITGTDYTTLSDWQTASSVDANAISGNPLYINATGAAGTVDLHLDNGTPAEAAGTSIGAVTTDYDGDTRSSYSPTDIGADAGDFAGISWSGATNTDWSTGTNWTGNAAPLSTENAIIPTGLSNYPDITTGTISCKSVSVKSGGTLNVTGGTLQVSGNIMNSGTFNATGGSVTLNGSIAQYITAGTLTATNLTLNNSAGATISSGIVNLSGTYTPTSGTLTTGGYLTLKSTASGTARIAAGSGSGGYISGNVTIERYIPGKRAFRFFAHPFTSSIALSQLTDDIDITGSGGSANGFTTTGSNNPSSFWYDVTTGDNSTTGNNPGWIAFTHTNGNGANAWNQYQAARILVRGAIGEGLTSAAYTPSAATLDMSGTMNQGDVTINLTKGSSTNFVLAGNPFPSQVNMDALTNTNVGSSFFIWDANQGTRGGYTSYSFGSSSFNLPSCGAFTTTLSANGSIVFGEGDKTPNTSGTMFKTTAPKNTVQLRLEDSTTFWDRLLLRFDDNAMSAVDYPDAVKIYNPDISFYTLSKDDSMLSIDARPYAENDTIPLGLYSTLQKNFKIIASDFDIPAGTKLFLHDKYLNKTEEITAAGYEYWFTVDGDTASWGDNRFELSTQGKPTDVISMANAEDYLKIKLVPNPATNNVTIYYEGVKDGNIHITVTNILGMKVAEAEQVSNQTGSIIIPLQNIANGIYTVSIQNGHHTIIQKLIKQ